MSAHNEKDTVVGLPKPSDTTESAMPNILTKTVWFLWLASLGTALLVFRSESIQVSGEIIRIDGLTVVMWLVVTFFSGIVHSYSRRYMAGDSHIDKFYANVFGFTLLVILLVAANHIWLFWLAWLGMGVAMANLVGHVPGWKQSKAARRTSIQYFLGGSLLLGIGLTVFWWTTGSVTITGVTESLGDVPMETVAVGGGAIVLAAMVQSALIPFHGWLLSSMTAPTPASALMHAGFVNGGGILLTRFSPVFGDRVLAMTAIVVLGAVSAILGKLMKSVQPDIKTKLGCSTVGQMGFMIMQAGLGFFGAAITHLILHGFYKAYLFLSSSGKVANKAPKQSKNDGLTAVSVFATLLTALAGGTLFALLTGKGMELDTGLLLTVLVVVMTLHASQEFVSRPELPRTVRFLGVPVIFLPAIALYAGVYNAISWAMTDLPMTEVPYEMTPVHVAIVATFLVGYVAVELGVQHRSERLYTTLLSMSQPSPKTLFTTREEYND